MLAQPIVGNLGWVVLLSPRELITGRKHTDSPVLRDIPNRLIGINRMKNPGVFAAWRDNHSF